jgi:hypothetical protein
LGTASNILSGFESEIFGLQICLAGIGVHLQKERSEACTREAAATLQPLALTAVAEEVDTPAKAEVNAVGYSSYEDRRL